MASWPMGWIRRGDAATLMGLEPYHAWALIRLKIVEEVRHPTMGGGYRFLVTEEEARARLAAAFLGGPEGKAIFL